MDLLSLTSRYARLVATPVVVAMVMVLAGTASAATVTAAEGPLSKAPGLYATATVEARPSEANRLSIKVTGELGRYLLQVRDEAEPI